MQGSTATIPPGGDAVDAPTSRADFPASTRSESSLLALSPSNPFRPVDWRWRLGVFLANDDPSRGGGWTGGQSTAASSGFKRIGKVDKPRRPAPGDYVIEQAYRLHAAPDALQRCEIEARLLAGESFEQIAEKCNSTPEVIEAFHALFFDVRGCNFLRLDARYLRPKAQKVTASSCAQEHPAGKSLLRRRRNPTLVRPSREGIAGTHYKGPMTEAKGWRHCLQSW